MIVTQAALTAAMIASGFNLPGEASVVLSASELLPL